MQNDNKPLFDILLDQSGVNLNLKTTEDHPPLYFALIRHDDDPRAGNYAEVLVEKGVATDCLYAKQNGNSLLQVVTSMGLSEAAVFLAAHVSNVDHANNDGQSALHLACAQDFAGLTKRLLGLGANPNLQTYEVRETALHACVSNKSLSCVRVFIEFNRNIEDLSPVDFNVRDSEGNTPIMVAVSKGQDFNDVVLLLIEGKADLNVRNNNDFTLLHLAIMKEDVKTSLFLLENGADVNAE